MAKSARSNAKKAVRAQRREKLKANWQDAADQRRYEALANAALGESVKAYQPPASDVMEEERGRVKPEKKKRQDAMDVEDGEPPASSRSVKRKGTNVRGVQKRHNKKKVSALWVSEFHKSKKGTLKGKKGG